MKAIRIVIVDDHPVLRKGIRALFEDVPDVEVVGQCHDGNTVLEMVEQLAPDVLLLDVSLPNMNGIEIARILYERQSEVNILILSAYDDPKYIRDLLDYGVKGYLLKDEAAHLIVQAVRGVAHGETNWFSRTIEEKAKEIEETDKNFSLTRREKDVLTMLVQGNTNSNIGSALSISEKTVEKHLDLVYRKLGVRSRTEAAVLAVQKKLV